MSNRIIANKLAAETIPLPIYRFKYVIKKLPPYIGDSFLIKI